MAEQKSDSWKIIPVAFYFRVTFTIDGSSHQCPFTSVEGLGQTLDYKTQAQQGDNVVWLPEKVTHTDITLKRALRTAPDAVNQWIKDCFDFQTTGKLTPCELRIDLLNNKEQTEDEIKAKKEAELIVLASWTCSNVVPKSWAIDMLNAQESKVLIQTLVLKHSRIEQSCR